MKNYIYISLSTVFIALLSLVGLHAQSPGNLVRGYTFQFTFEETEGVAPDVDEMDEYLIVSRENDRGERIGQADGEDYLWDFTYAKVPPRGATLELENATPPEPSEDPEEEPVVYYVTQNFTMEFEDPFNGTFTYTVTDSEEQTGTASGSFVLVRGPWEGLEQDPESGWAYSEWNGNLYVINFPWVYSEDEGWVYVDAEEQDDMWQFRDIVGWNWTGESNYPWVYQSDEGRWLYVYLDDPESEYAVYFIGDTGDVIIVPKG